MLCLNILQPTKACLVCTPFDYLLANAWHSFLFPFALNLLYLSAAVINLSLYLVFYFYFVNDCLQNSLQNSLQNTACIVSHASSLLKTLLKVLKSLHFSGFLFRYYFVRGKKIQLFVELPHHLCYNKR